MQLEIPELCVVALIGASGSGKTTFANTHFKATEVLSSDFFRGLVADDENDQSATTAAFDSLYYIANKRLDAHKLVVIDATNVQQSARQSVLRLAKDQDCFAVAIVFNFPAELCQARNQARPDRNFGSHVIANQTRDLKRSIRHLQKEGFRLIYVLNSPAEAEAVTISRTKLWSDRRDVAGPFDIIGDIHGCFEELCVLLTKLGYTVDRDACTALPPTGRTTIFLGDLCDRGPNNLQVLQLIMHMHTAGTALVVLGNHDVKLLKHLRGSKVQLSHGLDITSRQLATASAEFNAQLITFLDKLISHYVLADGKLVVAHAGIKERYQGRSSSRVRNFCLYGETTGETDEFGLPVRLPWAEQYRGRACVVYGHTPSLEVQAVNNTLCIDTGCVFGGKLTAYRYPEQELVQVPALEQYYQPVKPLLASAARSELLNINDVQGKRQITTRLYKRPITVQAENAAAALEIMSRFAADPRWLIYLPPTMSPCATSSLDGWLEHPTEAFMYYKQHSIDQVVCEQKHMGSRAVIIICRNAASAQQHFGITDGSSGIIYTRTGRRFFDNSATEHTILTRLCTVLTKTKFWEQFNTDWVCLDTELMPWSAKAKQLLLEQYAPVGHSGHRSLQQAVNALEQASKITSVDSISAASSRTIDLHALLAAYKTKQAAITQYTTAYRQYCWPIQTVDDYRVAPFHILATAEKVWKNETHLMHLATIKQYLTGIDPLFIPTNHTVIDLNSESSIQHGIDWWLQLTKAGGEGMVVKPLTFTATANNELLQPAVKCRGQEYLRIIYGPEYLLGDHLTRLKQRSLSKKRRLALAEFALGMEALERFVEHQPLYCVHECVFAILAMESEPVDPRL